MSVDAISLAVLIVNSQKSNLFISNNLIFMEEIVIFQEDPIGDFTWILHQSH